VRAHSASEDARERADDTRLNRARRRALLGAPSRPKVGSRGRAILRRFDVVKQRARIAIGSALLTQQGQQA
jgi:hypothetical protein